MIRRPPRSTLFPYNDALPICPYKIEHRSSEIGTKSLAVQARAAIPSVGDQCLLIQDSSRARKCRPPDGGKPCGRSEEHTSELQSQSNLVCRLLLEKKKD